jgi:hypothetical protein
MVVKIYNIVIKNVRDEWGIYINKDMIKRILKSFNISWHRIKRGVALEPDPEDYKVKKQELEELKRHSHIATKYIPWQMAQEERGEIDLRFVDATGFSLSSYVPYAWQEKGD